MQPVPDSVVTTASNPAPSLDPPAWDVRSIVAVLNPLSKSGNAAPTGANGVKVGVGTTSPGGER